MVVVPGLAHQVEGLELVDPAEQFVQLRGDQELPAQEPFSSSTLYLRECLMLRIQQKSYPTF